MTQLKQPSPTFEALSLHVRAQNILGWQHLRQVAYLHRHPELTGTYFYHWDHQRKQPVATASQQLFFYIEGYLLRETRRIQQQKLVVDMELGLNGKLQLITGLSTQAATSIMASWPHYAHCHQPYQSDPSNFESSQRLLKEVHDLPRAGQKKNCGLMS